jgi:hypothetical protein
VSATPSPEFDRLAAALAGQYAVEKELGRGGMGVVVLARDLRLDRLVALKTLPQHLADDPIIRERFLREARTAAALSHPRIVPIHHAAEVNGTVFFVMGFIAGGSVAQLIRDHGRVPARLAVPLLIDVAEALGYAHEHGVVHRDIKAENILIDSASGGAMVTDFGIARLAEATPMTATGAVLGTVHYMSPEQVNGESLDGRSDLYALGVLAFLMLTGRFPFEHEASSAVLVSHVMRQPPALRDVAPQVPADVALIVDRLLRKDPADRCANAAELVAALEAADLREVQVPGDPAAPRVISSAEANEVWERAALLQQMTGAQVPPPLPTKLARPQGEPPATAGYRMEDVLAAAQEAGIEEKYVQRAVAERAPVPAGTALADGVVRPGAIMDQKPGVFVGSRTRLEYEAVIDGELHPEDYEELVDEIRRAFGEFGSASIVGRTITFISTQPATNSGNTRRLQVTVSARGGRTTIRAHDDLRQAVHGAIGGITGGVGGGFGGAMAGLVMGVVQLPILAISTVVGVSILAYSGSRFGVRKWTEKKQRDLHEAVRRIAGKAQELVSARSLASPPVPPMPRRLRR